MKAESFVILIVEVTVALAITTSVMAADPPAVLPQTGQTACWNASGSPVTCAGTGQDGDKQSGTASPDPRFSDNGNGTVTDNLSGLIWLTNANCFNVKSWASALFSANNLSSGTCGLTDGSKAGDWRMPNRKELLSLLNRQQSNNSEWLNISGFSAVQPATYWTSTSKAGAIHLSWSVDFKESKTYTTTKSYPSCYVWPVRGGQ